MRHIQAVTFDCWHTLIYDTPEDDMMRGARRIQRVRQVLRRLHVPVAENVLEEAHEAVWQRLGEVWATNVDVSIREQVTLFLQCCGAAGRAQFRESEWAELESAYVDAFDDIPPRVVDDAGEVLDRLRAAGYRLGLLCNTGRTPGAALRRFLGANGLLPCFETLLFSDETLERKPSPLAFARALEHLKAVPNGAVHVGDDPTLDVFGAKQSGLWAIQFRGSEFRHRRKRRRAKTSQLVKSLMSVAPAVSAPVEETTPDLIAHRLSEIPLFLERIEKMWPTRYGEVRPRS
ncbi:MAG: HAD family hydrolase [Planctomycetes bacterium]|nr:HAD family hydrolase [Planctomycetota bacterium]